MKFNELSANKNRKYNGIERPKTSPENISELMDDEIFVFGSNLQGAHGGGAALVAKKALWSHTRTRNWSSRTKLRHTHHAWWCGSN